MSAAAIHATVLCDVTPRSPDPMRAVLPVVPGEEASRVGVGVLVVAKGHRAVRQVLKGPEVALEQGGVVARARPGVGLGDAEVGEGVGNGLGDHRGAGIGTRADGPSRRSLDGPAHYWLAPHAQVIDAA